MTNTPTGTKVTEAEAEEGPVTLTLSQMQAAVTAAHDLVVKKLSTRRYERDRLNDRIKELVAEEKELAAVVKALHRGKKED